ncbi:MAG: IS3 family transposase [Lachnospiraceae bacterium]
MCLFRSQFLLETGTFFVIHRLLINQYMQWYRDKRIKLSLGGLSPMEYRRSLGIA